MSSHKKPVQKAPPRFLGMPFVSGVTLFYLLAGEFWIFFTDLLLDQLKIEGDYWSLLSSFRGLLFIYSSGAVLFLTLNHFFSRIQAIRKLHEDRKRYALATSAAHIGVWDRDIVNDRLVWDDRMIQIYGIPHKEFDGTQEAWKRCIHPDDRNRAEQAVKATERGGKDFDTEFRIVRPDGEVRHIRAFGKVIRDEAGKPVRMTGVNYDVTENKLTEETLRLRNEELERFNHAATDRELRMIELKNEINQLRQQMGQSAPYRVTEVEQSPSVSGTGWKALLRKLFGKG